MLSNSFRLDLLIVHVEIIEFFKMSKNQSLQDIIASKRERYCPDFVLNLCTCASVQEGWSSIRIRTFYANHTHLHTMLSHLLYMMSDFATSACFIKTLQRERNLTYRDKEVPAPAQRSQS